LERKAYFDSSKPSSFDSKLRY